MIDTVEYEMPMEWFGNLVNDLIVSRRLEEVFLYRQKKTDELLGRTDKFS
ncbi:SRPBCC family protein [Chlorobium phaeobacteroides]|jgi:ligand-binding SRPBCC domain-containing protein|nr:hypothetical protein [Chlorobium phaeobacteroides]